jgi:hypothetical protein
VKWRGLTVEFARGVRLDVIDEVADAHFCRVRQVNRQREGVDS